MRAAAFAAVGAADGAADERPVAELILGVQGGARVVLLVGDALAAAGGDGGGEPVVAILRQGHRAVEHAAGSGVVLERHQAADAFHAVGGLGGELGVKGQLRWRRSRRACCPADQPLATVLDGLLAGAVEGQAGDDPHIEPAGDRRAVPGAGGIGVVDPLRTRAHPHAHAADVEAELAADVAPGLREGERTAARIGERRAGGIVLELGVATLVVVEAELEAREGALASTPHCMKPDSSACAVSVYP